MTDEVIGETPEPTEGAPEAPPEEEFDKERALATIRKLREFEKQAKAQAKELATLKAADEERKRAEMSETDKLKADLEAARKDLATEKTERVRAQVRAIVAQAASEFRMHDKTGADALANLGRMELDEEGQIPDLKKRMDALKAAKPWLFEGQATISPTNPPGAPQKPSDDQVLTELFGKSHNRLFDGGGVVWNQPE